MYIIATIIIVLDQISKKYAVKYLKNGSPIEIIDNFFQLSYVQNYGAAFGILQNKQLFFIITTIIIIFGIIYFMKVNNTTKTINILLMLIIGGAIGNLIDRIRLGYVIDFLDIKFGNFYDYPVFNLADSFIVIGTIILDNYLSNEKE